jgi:hypothetical protein
VTQSDILQKLLNSIWNYPIHMHQSSHTFFGPDEKWSSISYISTLLFSIFVGYVEGAFVSD